MKATGSATPDSKRHNGMIDMLGCLHCIQGAPHCPAVAPKPCNALLLSLQRKPEGPQQQGAPALEGALHTDMKSPPMG